MDIDPVLKKAKILVVDDQLPNVKLLEKLLHVSGFTSVEVTTDPVESLRLYQDKRHDLILLDIRMPRLSGFEVMEKLKEIEGSNYIPVLVLTAQTDLETKTRAFDSGARDFLTKPFDRVEAIARIRNQLEVRLLHQEINEQNRMLEQRVRERTQELHDTRLDIIRRLGRASEYRDNETGLHIIRMSKYAEVIGRQAGISYEMCDILLNASPMHDLGKLGIPDRILLKPGKLDPEEWMVMKTHTTIGAELLSGGDNILMESARQIALTHHERWDGSGYPLGIQGEEIPLMGRVAAISDVFDALTSDRPYKKAWPVDEAVEEILRQSGHQFDPGLIPCFESGLTEILAIKENFSETS